MSKKKIEKPKGKLTRRQLSRWQQQKRRQRIILFSGISVLLAVFGLIFFGLYFQWYLPEVKPLGETVLEVNGIRYKMDYYIESLKYQLGDYTYLVEYYLDPILDSIKQSELARENAAELGFIVSDSEVDEELKDSEYIDNQAVRDIVETQLLIDKLREEYFGPQVPASAEQRLVLAMFLESQAQADEVRARIGAGEDFGQLAGELSLDSFAKEKKGDLGWRPEGVLNGLLATSIIDDYVFSSEVGVLNQPVYDEEKTKSLGYWLVEVLEKKEDLSQVHVRAMLLSSEEEALTVKERLAQGEDFNELAKEFSQRWTEEDGADFGWISAGTMSQAFEDFAFNPETELNMVSSPIRDETTTTEGGYWLTRALESGTWVISDEDRGLLIGQALNDWWSALLDNPENNIVSYLDERLREFAVRKVAEE